MSNYTKQISWSGKDALSDSDPEKVISGGDFDTEFSAVQTAINSKIDTGGVVASDIASNAITDAKISGMSSSKLSGALPAISGASLTGVGKVLQVQSFAFTGTTDTTAQDNTFVDTGLTVNITPSATTSKILVMASIGKIGGNYAGQMYNLRIVRDSTNVLLGDVAGSRTLASAGGATSLAGENNSITLTYLDSPATTSATTYKITYSGMSSYATRINYSRNDGNTDAPSARAASTITVMEIGA